MIIAVIVSKTVKAYPKPCREEQQFLAEAGGGWVGRVGTAACKQSQDPQGL